jgi:hypothetical protein
MKFRGRTLDYSDLWLWFLFAYWGFGIFMWFYVALPWFQTDQFYTCDPVNGGQCHVLVDSVWGIPIIFWTLLMGAVAGLGLWLILYGGVQKSGST